MSEEKDGPTPSAAGDLARWARSSTTESVNPRTVDIDLLDTSDIVTTILNEDLSVVPAVLAEADAIARLAELTVERLRRGGRLIYVGSGSSGRLGMLDAAECPPTFGTDPGQVVALISGGLPAVASSFESTEDDHARGRAEIAVTGAGPDDVVLGIAASGRTPYVLGAVAEARARGALVAGLACTSPSPLEKLVDLMIAPIVGPEVISGSTRMKAGTAQKLVLNTLSTTVMIRLGKTYRNLMVDVRPTNEKLRHRVNTIVSEATGLPLAEAARLLDEAAGDAKVAIVRHLAGVSPAAARELLNRAGGRVRAALDLAGDRG